MANMEAIIDAYLITNGIDESGKDSLISLVNQCFSCYIEHMSKEWIGSGKPKNATAKPKSGKATKLDKLEDIDRVLGRLPLDSLWGAP